MLPQLLQRAVQYHQQGQLESAETLYRQVLQLDPRNSDAHHLLGLIAHARQHYPLAIDLIKKAIRFNPKAVSYHINLGTVLLESGDLTAAHKILQTATKLNPKEANVWHNLGQVCYQQGQFKLAVQHYQRAISLNPQIAKFHNNLGNVFSELKRYEEAIACFQHAVKLQPNFPEAYNNWGATLKDQGKLSEAVACFQTGLQWAPNFVAIYHNLGLTLREQGQIQAAIACFQRVLTLQPHHAEAYRNLGDLFREQKHYAEATTYYQHALAINPQPAQIYNNLGLVCYDQHQLPEAIAHYQHALALDPTQVQTHYNLGNALVNQGQFTQAIACFQHTITLINTGATNPNLLAKTYNNLGMAMQNIGHIETALDHFEQALTIDPTMAIAYSNLLFTLHYRTQYDNAAIFAKHQQFNQRYVIPLSTTFPRYYPLSTIHYPLINIAYVSSDFRRHSVAYFIENILAHHDPQQFKIFCYYNNTQIDEVTQRLQSYVHQFTACEHLSDEQLAAQIRQDKIDILVDLTGHFDKNRLLTFARKPAPIQVSYLGYSDTTGVTTIDYRITDNYVEPEGVAEAWSSETLLRMTPSYFCYRPYDLAPPVNELPAKTNGYITFGSFNHLAKLSPEILSLWEQLLQALPTARLLLKTKALDDPQVRQSFAATHFSEATRSRLILSPFISATESHLQLYQQVDIALDTFPYNGATTTCEALWMGVPVVTLVGQRHTSRMGLSILSTVGLTELIADTPAEYLKIGIDLANNLTQLDSLRHTLRERLQASPLLDGVGLTRQLEACYQHIYQTQRSGPNLKNLDSKLIQMSSPNLHNSDSSLTKNFESSQPLIDQAWQYHRAGHSDQAEMLCSQILENTPQHSGALHLKGLIAYQAGRHQEGIDLLQQARQLNPREPYLYSNLGIMLSQQDRITDTIACYQQALTLSPQDSLSHNNLGKEFYHQGRIEEALAHFRQALAIQPNYAKAYSNLLMALNYLPDDDPVKLFKAHRQFDQLASTISVTKKLSFSKKLSFDSRLKIGYLSADFKRHSVAYFMEAVLAHHDHQHFEIFCYYNHSQCDEVTQRLQTYADHFRFCESLSDDELATQIHQDHLDILVDLNGHTANNRLLVLMRTPAPVQLTYLGYSGTTGLSSINYRITDTYADPIGTADPVSSETLIRMPHSYFCYTPDPNSPPLAPELPALRNGYITFGSFNNYAKLSQPLLEIWAQLLHALPTAKLIIKAKSLSDPGTRQLAETCLLKLGISAERLTIVGYASTINDHLNHYQQIDIALDSFPYNGATTTCETLWMGIPVVTLVGKTHVARMGLSILSTVGLSELITYSPSEYLQTNLQLANNWAYLQTLRQTLRTQMQNSPLMQGEGFTRDLEAKYRGIFAN